MKVTVKGNRYILGRIILTSRTTAPAARIKSNSSTKSVRPCNLKHLQKTSDKKLKLTNIPTCNVAPDPSASNRSGYFCNGHFYTISSRYTLILKK